MKSRQHQRRTESIGKWLSGVLAAVMLTQAMLGLVFRAQYRDVDWIRVTWLGNDWFTLVVAAPLLLVAMQAAGRGSTRAELIWLGVLGYGVYNFAFYMLGAVLNVFFPLYVIGFVLAVGALLVTVREPTAERIAGRFESHTPVRAIGGTLAIVGFGLSSVWLGMWAAHAFAGAPTPATPEVFRLVAALDLGLMVPALASGGILLWRRNRWGYVIAPAAAIQGALYLSVLTVNSMLVRRSGLSASSFEAFLWGALALVMVGASLASLQYCPSDDVSTE